MGISNKFETPPLPSDDSSTVNRWIPEFPPFNKDVIHLMSSTSLFASRSLRGVHRARQWYMRRKPMSWVWGTELRDGPYRIGAGDDISPEFRGTAPRRMHQIWLCSVKAGGTEGDDTQVLFAVFSDSHKEREGFLTRSMDSARSPLNASGCNLRGHSAQVPLRVSHPVQHTLSLRISNFSNSTIGELPQLIHGGLDSLLKPWSTHVTGEQVGGRRVWATKGVRGRQTVGFSGDRPTS